MPEDAGQVVVVLIVALSLEVRGRRELAELAAKLTVLSLEGRGRRELAVLATELAAELAVLSLEGRGRRELAELAAELAVLTLEGRGRGRELVADRAVVIARTCSQQAAPLAAELTGRLTETGDELL